MLESFKIKKYKIPKLMKYLALLIVGGVIFLSHYSFSKHAIYGDGIDYWIYLTSVYFDHDIDFTNQYKHYFEPINNNLTIPNSAIVVMKTSITDIGKTDNPHPPGTAIVWVPAFLFADILSLVFKFPRSGYTDIYQISTGLWSVFLVILALFINEKIIFKFTKDNKISYLSVFAIFLATPLLYYGSYDILNSHFASFLVASLFWYVLFYKPTNTKDAFILGVLIGFAALIRLQDVIFLKRIFRNKYESISHPSTLMFKDFSSSSATTPVPHPMSSTF